jgi:hypothetical protein
MARGKGPERLSTSLRILLAVLVFSLSACGRQVRSTIPNPQPVRLSELVIVISGQSNAVSATNNIDPPSPAVFSETGQVYLTHTRGDELFFRRVPTMDRPSTGSAAWVYLGDLIAKLTGRSVHIINAAHGNTSSVGYQSSYSAELLLAVSVYKPEFVIWIQGESDTEIELQESRAAMRSIIDSTRKVVPNLRWFVALNGYAHNANYYPESLKMPIRRVQQELIDDGTVRAGVDIDLLRSTHPEYFEAMRIQGFPGPEFIRDGIRRHAEAWFEIVKGTL